MGLKVLSYSKQVVESMYNIKLIGIAAINTKTIRIGTTQQTNSAF